MESGQLINLLITHIDKEGPFLKVWGQAEKSSSVYVEQFLSGVSRQFDQGISIIPPENLQVGSLVAAKYKDGKYYRARILSIDVLNECFIEVSFIDFGNKDILPALNLRSLQSFPTSFVSIPPLATSFIFAEAHSPHGGEWNEKVYETIHKELCFREVQCTLVAQATQFYLVKLFIGGSDLGTLLVNRGLMQPISIQAQQAVLLSLSMQQRLVNTAAAIPNEINTYKACTLQPGCQYPVYVSYVNEGPTHFSVQLRQSEEVLVKLMKEINSVTLKLLEEVPLPGTICLARCQEDSSICRAVVTNEVDNQFKVFYVDFGNYEIVPLEALYQIPFKFVIPKVMAIRFGLVGIEKSSVTIEMKCAFKKFVDNRLLNMKVLPSPTRTSVSKCELWDPETKVSALEVVQRAALNAYPEPLSLTRGFSQPVKVSYVFSCNRFYVQLISKEAELANLMADLQVSCQNADVMDSAEIKAQLPCCALFEGDQQWYRSQIVEVADENNVKVSYIDYGNEEIVPLSLLKIIEGELLTVLRPQAIECCLNGYQNMDVDMERDSLLEELILEKQFTMKVVEMMDKKALVELIDETNSNVASLLLDKIAASKAPISPVVSRTDQDWRSQQKATNDGFRQERRPPRDSNKNWSENRTNERPRRQENGDFRQDTNFNDNSSDGNWRQDNKSSRGDRPPRRDINERLRRDPNKNTDSTWNNDFSNTQPSTETATDEWGAADNSSNKPANDIMSHNGPQGDGGWNDVTPQTDGGFRDGGFKKPRDDKFGGRNKRFDNDRDNWSSRDGRGDGGYKKKSDFKRDDMSSSGSEKSFKKGPRTSSRNDRQRNDRFGGGGGGGRYKSDKFENSLSGPSNAEDSWNVSAVSLPPIDAASSTDQFQALDVVGSEAGVNISWFYNPASFYCQLSDFQTEFKQMMEEIQEFYKNRKPESAVTGSPVVGLFPEDNVLYRARVLDAFGSQYKVLYVDFGNISTIDKLWPIEKKFMTLPAQAVACGLNAIGPPGETWPGGSSYGKYFEKEKFVARFLYKDEERTYVHLFDGDQELSQLLVNDGMAVALAQQPATLEMEIPLLLGQQFRAVLKSINNLSDIIVALECGVALNCKAHNLDLASETFEDNLRAYLEQTVILYIDNIVENNVLEATFYDTDGNKLVTLLPDEGAFEVVEPLCPLLVLSSIIWGYVSYVEEQSAFIQPSEYADSIAVLLEQMFEYYEKQVQESPLIPEEGLLYAARSSDSNWYRARALSFDDEQVTVKFIDYGNSESLPFSELRELDNQFHVPNMMCIEIHIQTPAESWLEKDVVATVYFGELGWEGTIQEASTQAEPALAALEVAPVPSEPLDTVQEVPTAEKFATIPEETTPAPQEAELAEETPVVEGKGTPVIVSHIDSPNEFYLQRAETSSELEEVQTYLQEVADSLEVLESAAVGVLCAAPYSVDHEWYRAEVLDADEDITTVRFVDYGNTDVINNKTTQIKTLPPCLLSLAVHATKSSLKVKPVDVDGEWSQTALECFEELAHQEEVLAEFVSQDEKTNYVDLYVHGNNVAEALIQQNHARPYELKTETKSTGFVSHLNSPSEFWIQLESCVDELEWIAEQLSGAVNFPELEDLTPGTLCAALFADDEMWYRARILSNTVAGIELLFIDYGNSCISASLRQLPEDLVVTAPLAQKCSLHRPIGIPNWTPQACEKFEEISAEGQTIFTVKKISTGETSTVDLILNEISIVELLLPETVDGYVKNVESLDKFNVEIHGAVSETAYKLEPLPGLIWDDSSCAKFKEVNNEGSTLFQIEIFSEDTVRIYKDRSDIRLNLGGAKVVPPTALDISETDKTAPITVVGTEPEVNVAEEIAVEYDESHVTPSPNKVIEDPEQNAETSDNIVNTDDSQFCDTEPHNTQETEDLKVVPQTALYISETDKTDQITVVGTEPEVNVTEEIAVEYDKSHVSYTPGPNKVIEDPEQNADTSDNIVNTDDSQFCDTEPQNTQETEDLSIEAKDITPDSLLKPSENIVDVAEKDSEAETTCEISDIVTEPEKEQADSQIQTGELSIDTKDITPDSFLNPSDKDSDIEDGKESNIETSDENVNIDEPAVQELSTVLTIQDLNTETLINEVKESKTETCIENLDDISEPIMEPIRDSSPDSGQMTDNMVESPKSDKSKKSDSYSTISDDEVATSSVINVSSTDNQLAHSIQLHEKLANEEKQDVDTSILKETTNIFDDQEVKAENKKIESEKNTRSKETTNLIAEEQTKRDDEHIMESENIVRSESVGQSYIHNEKQIQPETVDVLADVDIDITLNETTKVTAEERTKRADEHIMESENIVIIDSEMKIQPKTVDVVADVSSADVDTDITLKETTNIIAEERTKSDLDSRSDIVSTKTETIPKVEDSIPAIQPISKESAANIVVGEQAKSVELEDDTYCEKSEPSSGANSRPLSSCSGKISHDDRIVPAVVSRPQTPLNSDEETDEQQLKK